MYSYLELTDYELTQSLNT